MIPKFCLGLLFAAALSGDLSAEVYEEFDVAQGAETPLMASPPWAQKGEAMEFSDGKLVQHISPSPEEGSSCYYISPTLSGLIGDGNRDYGIEFKVKPLGDVLRQGNSHYANLLVAWSDAQKCYNLTIDLSSRDVGDGQSEGGLLGGGNAMAEAAAGINWEKPRTIFIGYEAKDRLFHLYVDGESVGTIPADTLGSDPVPEFFDRIVFGDSTSGQGGDVAAEWYFVRVQTENKPAH